MRGLERIGTGRTAAVYRSGDRALKVYANGDFAEVSAEAGRQRIARAAGLPAPAVHSVYETLEGVVLEMAFAEGAPLMRYGMDRDERMKALRMLVRLQREMHGMRGDGLRRFTDRLKERIGYAPLNGAAKDGTIRRVGLLDAGENSICHGDFHPLNILRDGERLTIIDWADAAGGAPYADACRSYVILLQAVGFRIAGVYLTMYCEAAGARREDVLDWLVPVAAARAADGQTDKELSILKSIVEGGQ